MSILTNDEINELSHPAARGKSVNACIMAAEKLIFEKLAGMELPWGDDIEAWLEVRTGAEIAAAFHQAFAQGAASQLSAEPVGYFDQNGNYEENFKNWMKDDEAAGWHALYTLKEPK